MPLSKIPRSTFYDWRKKRNIVTETGPGSEIDLDVESFEPSNWTSSSESELEAHCLEQTRDASNLQSATLSSDSESSSNEDYFEKVEDLGAYSALSNPNAEHDNPNVNGSGELDLADLFPEDEGEAAEDVLLDDVYDLDSEQEDLENLQNDHRESCLIADEERKVLYQGAPITLGASLLLVMTFAVRHGLSGVALTDLLILMELHCITPNLCRTSMKLLRDFFKRVRCPVELHYYCTFCLHYIGREKGSHCPNKHYLKDHRVAKNVSYFIVIPLVTQLCSLLAREYHFFCFHIQA